MTDIVERLRRAADGVLITYGGYRDLGREAADEIERLRAIILDACQVLEHYDLPEHAFHYQRVLDKEAPLNIEPINQ